MTSHEDVNRRYAEFQAFLREHYQAEGRGLIEMLRSVEGQVPAKLAWELRSIGYIRNQVVHDGLDEIPRYFEPLCKEAAATIKQLAGNRRRKSPRPVTKGAKPVAPVSVAGGKKPRLVKPPLTNKASRASQPVRVPKASSPARRKKKTPGARSV
jgi:hypothetical protein